MSAGSCSDCNEEGFPLVTFKVDNNSLSWEFMGPRKIILQQYPKESLTLDFKKSNDVDYNMTVKFDNNLHEVSHDYTYDINLRAFYRQDDKLYHVPLFSYTEQRTTDMVIFEDFQLEIKLHRNGFTNIMTYYNTFSMHRATPLHICCKIKRSNTRFNNFELPRDDLLREHLLSDMCLKVSDQEFQVHRAMLALHSSVFRAMFSHAETTESRTGVVKIEDIEAPVLEEMLCYVYTGNLKDGTSKFPVKLLKAAHKYDIAGLVAKCEEALMFEMRFTNIVELLDLANLYELETLKRGAMSFISIHEKEMVIDPSYQEFLFRDLSIDTFAYTLKLCAKYELPEVKATAFEFVKQHGKEISSREDYLNLLRAHPDLTQEILVFMHQNMQ